MKLDELLMVLAMEECEEVAHRFAKALRFGMVEVQKDQPLSNRQRIESEYADLVAVMQLLGFADPSAFDLEVKKAKVQRYLVYSKECGTLEDENPVLAPIVKACSKSNKPDGTHSWAEQFSRLENRYVTRTCVWCGTVEDLPRRHER